MADIAVGYASDRAPRAQSKRLEGAVRLVRRMQAWARLYRRRAAMVRTLGMLDARDRADIGLPTSPSLNGLERMARMYMMR